MPMSAGWVPVAGGAAGAVVMALLWWRQLRTLNAGSVDVAWTLLVGSLGAAAALLGDAPWQRRAVLLVLVAAWASRLAIHLARRVAHEPEDGRYHDMRVRWGARAPRNFFLVYEAQAVLAAVLSIPFVIAASSRSPLGVADVAGALLGAGALAGEAVADRQLAAWRQDPAHAGLTCRGGLWRWSRHPNYFFEWLQWCARALLACGAASWWLAWLLGPALMLAFLLKLSGIPFAEAQALRSRRDYAEYRRTTSAFVPLPPRARA